MQKYVRSPKDLRKQHGQEAEVKAAKYLADKQYEIIERNWQIRSGELDIIAKKGNTFIFVEVRSRHYTKRFGTAEESVDYRKQMKIRQTAQMYLTKHSLHHVSVRFDVIAVERSSEGLKINHIENAF